MELSLVCSSVCQLKGSFHPLNRTWQGYVFACFPYSLFGLFFLCPSLPPVEQIILSLLKLSALWNFQHHSLTSSLFKALLSKQATNLKLLAKLRLAHFKTSQKMELSAFPLLTFLHPFPFIPPFSYFFFCLVAGAPSCWAVSSLQIVQGHLWREELWLVCFLPH